MISTRSDSDIVSALRELSKHVPITSDGENFLDMLSNAQNGIGPIQQAAEELQIYLKKAASNDEEDSDFSSS